jgi:hypothetical protein
LRLARILTGHAGEAEIIRTQWGIGFVLADDPECLLPAIVAYDAKRCAYRKPSTMDGRDEP